MSILWEPRGIEYFNNIEALIGFSTDRWHEVIIKETLDNALDAIDALKVKEINITCNENLFAICDNGNGIPEEDLARIYNFDLHVSSKRHRRKVSRGAQGNALKTIIALCYNRNKKLYFVTNGMRITYTPDAEMIDLKLLEKAFPNAVEPTNQPNGVYVEAEITGLWDLLIPYMRVNPDVSFTVNGEKYSKFTDIRTLSAECSIHWYDSRAFSEIIKLTVLNHPETKTKEFISQFSGIKRIVNKLSLPGKRLKDFYRNKGAIKALFDELKKKTKQPEPKILEKYATGKKAFMKMCGDNFMRYRKVVGCYRENDALIPYLIEAVSEKKSAKKGGFLKMNNVTTCINNSKNYEDIPFNFDVAEHDFAGKKINAMSLHSILYESGFFKGTGHSLFIHFISPHHEFYNKAKSDINADKYRADLLATIEPLIMPIIKEVQRGQRLVSAYDNSVREQSTDKPPSKKKLMFNYFMEGAKISTGDWTYNTTARMVFYAVRKLAINRNGITLDGKNDFNTFTQTVITEMFKQHPELEDIIYFERRGFYLDCESGEEIPIHTKRVRDFVNNLNQRNNCDVLLHEGNYTSSKQQLIYPYELATSAVLFVEKQGFVEVFKKSGILDELNLGLISSQGFGTRAIKKMMQDLISRGIKVYALTDCDLAGQLIAERLADGSNTFKDKLEIHHIGLTYDDALALDKLSDAEEFNSTKSYSNVLERITDKEKNFFLKDKSKIKGHDNFIYRRVELNALTMPELLNFIRAKIPKKQLRPSREQILDMINFDNDALKRDAVMNYQSSKVDYYMKLLSGEEIRIDKEKAVEDIDQELRNCPDKKWQHVLEAVIERCQNKLLKQLQEKLPKD